MLPKILYPEHTREEWERISKYVADVIKEIQQEEEEK